MSLSPPRSSSIDVLVVGAGVFGAWTAEHLRRAGCRVILVEAAFPAHARASSGGESRMTRAAYGGDAIYSRMARDSLIEWQALSDAASPPLFEPHGTLFFTATPDDYFRQTIAVHAELGLPTEALDRAALRRRFPMIDFSDIELGLFEPGFGALMARRAVQVLVRRFIAAGGIYRQGRALPPAEDGALADVALADGSRIPADAFVFALGPWLPALFPELLGGRIVATRQEIFYFAPPTGDARFQPEAMPGWADFNGGDFHYGFPDLEGRGVKFAHDVHGPVVDPYTQDRRPSEEALAEILAFRDRRFPLLRGAPLVGAEVCQYENSANGDFIVDRHPAIPNLLVVGGGSGHGFKHGPEVGRHAAGLLLDTIPAEPRFRLATTANERRRTVH